MEEESRLAWLGLYVGVGIVIVIIDLNQHFALDNVVMLFISHWINAHLNQLL